MEDSWCSAQRDWINRLHFLGMEALVSLPTIEVIGESSCAIQSLTSLSLDCSHGLPIRFLLSKPEDGAAFRACAHARSLHRDWKEPDESTLFSQVDHHKHAEEPEEVLACIEGVAEALSTLKEEFEKSAWEIVVCIVSNDVEEMTFTAWPQACGTNEHQKEALHCVMTNRLQSTRTFIVVCIPENDKRATEETALVSKFDPSGERSGKLVRHQGREPHASERGYDRWRYLLLRSAAESPSLKDTDARRQIASIWRKVLERNHQVIKTEIALHLEKIRNNEIAEKHAEMKQHNRVMRNVLECVRYGLFGECGALRAHDLEKWQQLVVSENIAPVEGRFASITEAVTNSVETEMDRPYQCKEHESVRKALAAMNDDHYASLSA